VPAREIPNLFATRYRIHRNFDGYMIFTESYVPISGLHSTQLSHENATIFR
jgi:hypothetical protein